LTGTLLALSLILLGADDGTTAVVAQETSLTIDACIAVDKETVRQVMELEISDAHLLPATVSVRCVDDAQEIRIRRAAPPGREDVRTAHIAPASDNDTPAERQARSRELASSIAELVRWPGLSSPPPKTLGAPEPPLPVPAPPLATVSAPATEIPERHWQLGVLYAFDYFSRGQSLMGADLFTAVRLGRWYLAELHIGGRLGSAKLSAGLQLTTRAAAAAAGLGLNLWSKRHIFGAAIVALAQGYLAQFRGEGSTESSFTTQSFGALALAVEPRLMASLTPHLSLGASASVGWVPHGIVIRIQGVEAPSISGVAVSAKLGGVLTF
jgi:hypothetical protein